MTIKEYKKSEDTNIFNYDTGVVIKIQKNFRGYLSRRRYLHLKFMKSRCLKNMILSFKNLDEDYYNNIFNKKVEERSINCKVKLGNQIYNLLDFNMYDWYKDKYNKNGKSLFDDIYDESLIILNDFKYFNEFLEFIKMDKNFKNNSYPIDVMLYFGGKTLLEVYLKINDSSIGIFRFDDVSFIINKYKINKSWSDEIVSSIKRGFPYTSLKGKLGCFSLKRELIYISNEKTDVFKNYDINTKFKIFNKLLINSISNENLENILVNTIFPRINDLRKDIPKHFSGSDVSPNLII